MVSDNVSNSMIGKMRMQFWRDALKGISAVRRSLGQSRKGGKVDGGSSRALLRSTLSR